MTSQHPEPDGTQLHRLCVFDLSLDCGHIATVTGDGWYPVSVSCCERMGGTILRGVYIPYDSRVEFANVLSETYEHRPIDTPREPTRLLGRRDRTDPPRQPAHRWAEGTAGRFPARVGATWSIDGSTPAADSWIFNGDVAEWAYLNDAELRNLADELAQPPPKQADPTPHADHDRDI